MEIKNRLNKALFEILEEHEVPYTEEGLEFLKIELNKRLSKQKYEINIQPLSEVSAQDRKERKFPRIEITLK